MKQLFQVLRLGKRFLLPAVAFTISLAMSAQPYFQKPVSQSREIQLLETFDEIEVMGDATIILTDNLAGRILFQGDAEEVQKAKATIKNRKLVINANRKGKPGKFTVYVPTSDISLLTTSGKTQILSSGTIKVRDLEIYLNGSSSVSVRYEGKLNVVPGTGYELLTPKTR